jgi:hypothetical protein
MKLQEEGIVDNYNGDDYEDQPKPKKEFLKRKSQNPVPTNNEGGKKKYEYYGEKVDKNFFDADKKPSAPTVPERSGSTAPTFGRQNSDLENEDSTGGPKKRFLTRGGGKGGGMQGAVFKKPPKPTDKKD